MVGPAVISLDSCRKVFVDRDYSQGLTPRFVRELPQTLEGIINRQDWEEVIDTINREFAMAERVCASSAAETVFALLSCYITRLFAPTMYEKQLEKIRQYINEQNRKVFLPVGLHMLDPMERGLRIIEVSILTTGTLSSRPPSPNGLTSERRDPAEMV